MPRRRGLSAIAAQGRKGNRNKNDRTTEREQKNAPDQTTDEAGDGEPESLQHSSQTDHQKSARNNARSPEGEIEAVPGGRLGHGAR